jgi:hypothetical protein
MRGGWVVDPGTEELSVRPSFPDVVARMAARCSLGMQRITTRSGRSLLLGVPPC